MNIDFLDVGQGDTIVIRWNDNDNPKVGIVDCKKVSESVPVIEFLKKNKIQDIDFLILSHPHSDHFSGIYDLLEYIKSNGVRLRQIYFTAEADPNYIKRALSDNGQQLAVLKLYILIQNLIDEENVIVRIMSESDAQFQINDKWWFRVLSPSTREKLDFIRNAEINILDSDEEFGNNSLGNLLSSVLMFYTDNSYFLLTSDATIDTTFRIDKNFSSFFKDRKLLFAQICHHGSKYNYKKDFWKHQIKTLKAVPAIISAGKRYGHPHSEVINGLLELGYKVYTTRDLIKLTALANKNSLLLDLISTDESVEYVAISIKIDEQEVISIASSSFHD